MTSHSDHILGARVKFSKTLTEAPGKRIDGLLRDTFSVVLGPHTLDNFIAAVDPSWLFVEKLQHAVLGQ
jgi:hypothetical protein